MHPNEDHDSAKSVSAMAAKGSARGRIAAAENAGVVNEASPCQHHQFTVTYGCTPPMLYSDAPGNVRTPVQIGRGGFYSLGAGLFCLTVAAGCVRVSAGWACCAVGEDLRRISFASTSPKYFFHSWS